MSTTNALRNKMPTGRDEATHLFAIGQIVRLRGGYGVYPAKSGDIYRVTGTLPPRGGSPQYRIRNEGEHFERVTTEDDLEPIVAAQPGEGATLLAKTFGHGRG
ncbi:hypothetical protein [Ancylobacter defluvii]|uniref:Uncharacterized protein n=1 Tax=Ancylobacter defluvii TaxID=1282440 RepID=A0A9W6JYW3_9HYPH|nr:hypothetical protein [Ancylobacter defluvii]MBS7586068.1 hypothetical protein [Ancylobacter defluvii]GLK84454.1 hypothetical protein GCM10017653_25240 [Ancylobacter defluvii]